MWANFKGAIANNGVLTLILTQIKFHHSAPESNK